eukprot:TRINITY_DN6110_c1_g1_i1.p1 TRINITY_DN6110_c1_g1~~TRINITY_DN6110_c1_g1_i1.p1  ORF type:complete len:430 (+),score=100.87 TRINITY_DN6110_c1_g1_i1:49-1338(+)
MLLQLGVVLWVVGATMTPSLSLTRTLETATLTSTATPTATNSLSPSITLSATLTPSSTATLSVTHSLSLSATESVSVTLTPTSTASLTASLTDTLSLTIVVSPTATFTETLSATLSPTNSASLTASLSGTMTTSLTATSSVSLSLTLPTLTVTSTPSQTLRTATSTEGVSFTYTFPDTEVVLSVRPYLLQELGDARFSTTGWVAKLASIMLIDPKRVAAYWVLNDAQEVLRVTFSGSCSPCCGCVPVDPKLRMNGLTAAELHLEFLWKVACCPASCHGGGGDLEYCVPLGIEGVLFKEMSCRAMHSRGLCGFGNETCEWDSTSCSAKGTPPAPSVSDDSDAPLWLVLGAFTAFCWAAVGVLYFRPKPRRKATYEQEPMPSVVAPPPPRTPPVPVPEPVAYSPPGLEPPPLPPVSERKSMLRTWTDASWV